MRISYRFTSGAAVVAMALVMSEAFLPPAPLRPRPVSLEPGAVSWDPCSIWEQLHPMYRLAAFVSFGAFVVLAYQGIRNRSGPRWLAIAGVPALALWIDSDWWRISAGCYSSRSATVLFAWAATVSLMFFTTLSNAPYGRPVERER
jgi:hypothetical protein